MSNDAESRESSSAEESQKAATDGDSRVTADDRSAVAKAMDLATQVTTICLMLVFPALAGFFLDRWLGWGLIGTSLGLVLGLAISGFQLVQLVRRLERNSNSQSTGPAGPGPKSPR